MAEEEDGVGRGYPCRNGHGNGEEVTTTSSSSRSWVQREHHILSERQRREDMNRKFAVLNSILPNSSKKDKASIVGDAINYVHHLERTLALLQAGKRNIITKKKKRSKKGLILPQICSTNLAPHHPSPKQPKQEENTPLNCSMGEDPKIKGYITHVEAQDLGREAIIKVVYERQYGLDFLSILYAIEQCGVEILQTNLATIGNTTVIFFTIQNKKLEANMIDIQELTKAIQFTQKRH